MSQSSSSSLVVLGALATTGVAAGLYYFYPDDVKRVASESLARVSALAEQSKAAANGAVARASDAGARAQAAASRAYSASVASVRDAYDASRGVISRALSHAGGSPPPSAPASEAGSSPAAPARKFDRLSSFPVALPEEDEEDDVKAADKREPARARKGKGSKAGRGIVEAVPTATVAA